MRKIYRQLIPVCALILLAYCFFPILTEDPKLTVISSANALPERRGKVRSYRPRFTHYGKPRVEDHQDASPPGNIVDAVLQQTAQVVGRPVLLNYLVQLSPGDTNELQTVLNVAAEAHTQIQSDQVSTLDSMDQVKQSLVGLTQVLDSDFHTATLRYLDNLDRRRSIKRDIALREEEIQGLKLETGSESHRTQELTEAYTSLQSLQTSLDDLHVEIHIYEARLASAEIRSLLGDQHASLCERIEAYKKVLAAALDQDVILDKFDAIFAAMSSVHLEDI